MNRKGFIGGSDAVKIMRGEWLELWKIKTGRIEPDNLDHVLPVQIGILTEDLNLSWFEREEDNFITHKQLKIKKDLDGVPIKGTIAGKTLLSTSAEADNCYLSVIFGNLKWDWTKIPYDESYIATLLDMIKEFWGYIERDEEPDINRGEGL